MGGERQLLLAETMNSPAKIAPAPSVPPTANVAANATPPVDAPQSSGPPPFLTKTYEMVDDPSTHAIVSWSSANNSFVVWNPPEFAQELLPKYFKHNNFSSFVRQLNTYGFRKTDPDRWEFANEGFLRGRRDLLRTIHRRKPAAHPPQQQQGGCVEVGKFGLEAEIEKLKRDKNSLMLELVRMRQQQQNTEKELQLTTHRLQVTELRQQRMISFLAKAMLNPSLFAQFVSQQDQDNHVMRKKRRLPVHEDEGDMNDSISPESSMSAQSSDNQMVTFQRSGLGEDSARAMIYQMFFPAESPPGIDTNHFDCPMREMDVTPNSGGVNGFNRQSGVTLQEITTKFPDIYSSVPIVTDVSTVEVHECTPVAQPFDKTRLSGGNGSEDGSRYPHSEHRDSNETVEADWNRDTVSHEAEVQSARTDTSRLDTSRLETSRLDTARLEPSRLDTSRADTSHADTLRADTARADVAHADTARADTATHNSGFWSQFLTEDPRPVTASRQEREVQLETQNLFQDDKIAVKKDCPGSPAVDILSHQLGQLAPG